MQGISVAVWVTIPFKFKLSGEDKKTYDKDFNDTEMEKATESIKMNIESILKGIEREQVKQFASKNALLVYNKKTTSLYSVLNGEHRNIRLTEGKESKCVNSKLDITNKYSSALIIWTSSFAKGKKSEFIPSFSQKRLPMNGKLLIGT